MKEEMFLSKFGEVHKGKIKIVSYDDLRDNSTVVCKCDTHGEFSATVHNLVHHKIGCPFCRLHNSKSPFRNKEQLIYKLKLKYGNRFGYDKVEYGSKTIILTCPTHGDFEIATNYAFNKTAICPKCLYNTRRQHNSDKKRNPIAHTKWNNMIIRCFNNKYHKKQPTYSTCTVCDEWLDFNNFVEWFEDPANGYRAGYQLDKDLLGGGKKHYSPETCCFIPQTINALMTRGAKIRGKVKSIGVTMRNGKYIARCNFGHKEAKLVGRYNTEQEAFEAYKNAKRGYIDSLANDLYSKGEITARVYNGLLNYEIKQYD